MARWPIPPVLERQGNVQRTLPSGWLSPVWQALRERGSWLLLATTPAFPRPKTNNTQEGKRVRTAAGRYSLQADDKRTTISRRPAVVSWLVLTFRAYRTHVKKGFSGSFPSFDVSVMSFDNQPPASVCDSRRIRHVTCVLSFPLTAGNHWFFLFLLLLSSPAVNWAIQRLILCHPQLEETKKRLQ